MSQMFFFFCFSNCSEFNTYFSGPEPSHIHKLWMVEPWVAWCFMHPCLLKVSHWSWDIPIGIPWMDSLASGNMTGRGTIPHVAVLGGLLQGWKNAEYGYWVAVSDRNCKMRTLFDIPPAHQAESLLKLKWILNWGVLEVLIPSSIDMSGDI